MSERQKVTPPIADVPTLEPDHLLGLEPGEVEDGTRPVLWTRDFILLVAGNLSLFLGFYLLLPSLPLYAVELGGSEAAAGLVVGLFSISAVLIRPLAGWGLDRFGRHALIAGGLLLFALNSLLYLWAPVVVLLLAFRFLHGLSWGVSTTGMGAVAADLIPKPRLGEGMGYFGMAATVSMGVAPAAALAIVGAGSFTPLFLVSTGLATIAFLLAQFVRYPRVQRGQPRGFLSSLVAAEAKRPSLTAFFTAMTYGALLSFIALHAEAEGVANIGIFFSVYAVALTLARPVAGRLADRLGFDRVVLPGLVLMAATMAVLGLAHELPTFLLAAVLYGVGFGTVQPTLQALSVLDAEPDRRGAASATFFSAFDLGIGAGSAVGGILAASLGYGSMFLLYAAPLGLALIVFWHLRPRPLPG